MRAFFVFLATVAGSSLAGSSFAPATTTRASSAAQMSLDLACHSTRSMSGMTFTVTIRNTTPEPASIVVAYVRGNDVEHRAARLVFRLERAGSPGSRIFQFWPPGDRSGGGTGRLDRRIVVVAPQGSVEWSIDGAQLFSLATHEPFDSASDRGRLQVVFTSGQGDPDELPRLWHGKLESNIVQIPEGCR